jgi:hypothetical protein
MHVEDSYEGAMARLQRLERAGVVLGPPPSEPDDDAAARMRDLEELATTACDENERLQSELTEAQGELAAVKRELRDAREQIASLQRLMKMLQETLDEQQHQPRQNDALLRELAEARDQIRSLQRVMEMQESEPATPAPQPRAAATAFWHQPQPAAHAAPQQEIEHDTSPQEIHAPAVAPHQPAPFAADPEFTDEDAALALKSSRGSSATRVVLAIGGLCAAVGVLLLLRPWERPQSAVAAAALAPPPPAVVAPKPVVAAPPVTTTTPAATTPAVAATTPAAPAVVIPKAAAPSVTIPTAAPTKARPQRAERPAKRHVAKPARHAESKKKKQKAGAAKSSEPHGADPLEGLAL